LAVSRIPRILSNNYLLSRASARRCQLQTNHLSRLFPGLQRTAFFFYTRVCEISQVSFTLIMKLPKTRFNVPNRFVVEFFSWPRYFIYRKMKSSQIRPFWKQVNFGFLKLVWFRFSNWCDFGGFWNQGDFAQGQKTKPGCFHIWTLAQLLKFENRAFSSKEKSQGRILPWQLRFVSLVARLIA